MFWKLTQDSSDRRCDVRWRQGRGRDFVKEGLEKVVIGPINHGDANRFAAEFFCRFEPAKTGSNDHDMWCSGGRLFHPRNLPTLARGSKGPNGQFRIADCGLRKG